VLSRNLKRGGYRPLRGCEYNPQSVVTSREREKKKLIGNLKLVGQYFLMWPLKVTGYKLNWACTNWIKNTYRSFVQPEEI
jgi:hypothetical protein